MRYDVQLGGVTRSIEVRRADGGWRVQIDDGPERLVAGRELEAGLWRLDDRLVALHVDRTRVDLQIAGMDYRAEVQDPRRAGLALAAGGSRGVVTTPMPGVVVRVTVAVDDAVTEGHPLVVVEAMKMENEYVAPIAGTVTEVHVRAGQTVDADEVLVTIAPEPT